MVGPELFLHTLSIWQAQEDAPGTWIRSVTGHSYCSLNESTHWYLVREKANRNGESAELWYQSYLYSLTQQTFLGLPWFTTSCLFSTIYPPSTTSSNKENEHEVISRLITLSHPYRIWPFLLLLSCWAQTISWIVLTKLNVSMQNNQNRKNFSNLSPQQTNIAFVSHCKFVDSEGEKMGSLTYNRL